MFTTKRTIDYLRISVTDRCNLRCIYCVPEEGILCKGREEILSFEEILRLTEIFVDLGIKKVRLTGGEPLMRKNVLTLMDSLQNIAGLEEVSLTTNGVLLSSYARELKQVGIKRINISLDTLQPDKFRRITRVGELGDVLAGIEKAQAVGFGQLKLNMVVMRETNDDEIINFIDFAFSRGLILRFIEFMQLSPLWSQERFIPIQEIKRICERRFNLNKVEYPGAGPALYYQASGGGVLGFINTTKDNCQRCNRLRLTSTGELKICLYETEGLCLRSVLRKDSDDQAIKEIIAAQMGLKKGLDCTHGADSQFYMCKVGG